MRRTLCTPSCESLVLLITLDIARPPSHIAGSSTAAAHAQSLLAVPRADGGRDMAAAAGAPTCSPRLRPCPGVQASQHACGPQMLPKEHDVSAVCGGAVPCLPAPFDCAGAGADSGLFSPPSPRCHPKQFGRSPQYDTNRRMLDPQAVLGILFTAGVLCTG